MVVHAYNPRVRKQREQTSACNNGQRGMCSVWKGSWDLVFLFFFFFSFLDFWGWEITSGCSEPGETIRWARDESEGEFIRLSSWTELTTNMSPDPLPSTFPDRPLRKQILYQEIDIVHTRNISVHDHFVSRASPFVLSIMTHFFFHLRKDVLHAIISRLLTHFTLAINLVSSWWHS